MMQPNRVTTGHDRRGAVGRFTMSREEEEVLSIAKPPFYPSRRASIASPRSRADTLPRAGNKP
jgi:hypothetical protein